MDSKIFSFKAFLLFCFALVITWSIVTAGNFLFKTEGNVWEAVGVLALLSHFMLEERVDAIQTIIERKYLDKD